MRGRVRTMELLKQYFDLQKRVYDHFGYEENWVVIPLQDQTDCYWFLIEDAAGRGSCVYSDEPLTLESVREGKRIYGGSIYTQRFLPKWVYRAADFTMVCVDTHTDGNKFLMVFDNGKECRDESLKAAYEENWG